MSTSGQSGVIASYRQLDVWNLSMDLAVSVYEITKLLPKDEQFGLCSQMQRAAVSIPSNIAEGNARGSRKEYARFISIAIGSLSELTTVLQLARVLDLLPEDPALTEKCRRVAEMLIRLRQALEKPPTNSRQ
ncbi:MAG: four helix bundle protein [Fimbriimonadaceae bacterium]|nr:four helix bundle protein [Fimbriimonadaceae bacterium]